MGQKPFAGKSENGTLDPERSQDIRGRQKIAGQGQEKYEAGKSGPGKRGKTPEYDSPETEDQHHGAQRLSGVIQSGMNLPDDLIAVYFRFHFSPSKSLANFKKTSLL
jgi:hypothetical protein